MSTIPNAITFWRPALEKDAASSFLYHGSYDEISMFIRSCILTAGTFFVAINRSGGYAGLLIPFLPMIGRAFFHIEHHRVTVALNQLAIDLFMKNDVVPQRVMNYLSDKYSAVVALMAQPQVNLNKMSDHGSQTLLDKALSRTKSSFYDRDCSIQDALSVCKLLIDKGVDMNKNSFIYALEKCPEIAIYALEKDKVKGAEFTANEQFNCWINIKDNKSAELLTKKGFTIDIDNKGTTPLLYAIKSDKIKLMTLLINNGASLPNPNIEIEKGNRLNDFLQDKPKAVAILNQASSYQKPEAPFVLTESEPEIYAFWKPAIWIQQKDFNVFSIHDGSVMVRMIALASSVYALFCYISISLNFVPNRVIPAALLSAGSMAWLCYKYERSRATKTLNDLATQEFQTRFPAAHATTYISQNEEVINQLLTNGTVLTKVNEKGETLWDLACKEKKYSSAFFEAPFATKFSIFKKLADRLFEKNLPIDKIHAYFLQAVKSGYSEYVKYLLETGKVSFKEFNGSQLVECWTSLQDRESLDLFLTHGCDVNAVNDKGFTPLLRILASVFRTNVLDADFTKHHLVNALLKAGADLNVKLVYETEDADKNKVKVEKGVFDYVQDPASRSIKVLIEQHLLLKN